MTDDIRNDIIQCITLKREEEKGEERGARGHKWSCIFDKNNYNF